MLRPEERVDTAHQLTGGTWSEAHTMDIRSTDLHAVKGGASDRTPSNADRDDSKRSTVPGL